MVKYIYIVCTSHLQNAFSSWRPEPLCPLNIHSPVSPLPAPGNHPSTFCLFKFDYFENFILVELCSIFPLVTGLFPFA